MGMGMGTRLYPLLGGDGDETDKSLIPVGFGYENEDEFFLRE